jgi:hypothetical protein
MRGGGDENFFSSIRSNGVSKNPSFHTHFKNVYMTKVKSAPKKGIGKIGKVGFWLKLFSGHMYNFEISMKRRIF